MITTAPELIYMLKVNIGIALFYAFYKLFCCRDTFFQWRRIALLSFLALSFLYPLMDMQAWVKEQPAINELADYYALMMLTETNTSTATVVTAPVAIPTPDLLDIIKFVYWIEILLLSARFMIQLSSIFRLVLKSKSINVDQISIRSLSEPANPFSFWQWIFIYLPGLKEDEKQEILTHEQTHVRQWHSIDVIISEIVNIICWMNPFAWLLKTEIRLNLEYLADHKVMESGTNKKAYQYHLLGLANQNRQTGLYNNFNLSHLKNRIKMMNKKRTRTTGHIKYALFAPLTAALLLVSNIETVARTTERITNEVVETVAAIQTPKPGAVDTPAVYQDNDQIFTIVEVMPEFVDGGMQGCLKFLMDNTKYPEQAKRDKISGKVSVKFVIEKDGSITDAKVVRTDNPVFNEEALRVVNSMPKWKPGEQRGKEVRVSYTVPVIFSLDGKGYQKAMSTAKGNTKSNATQAQSDSDFDENQLFQIVEEMPEFPGGMGACLKFLMANTEYPEKAKAQKVEGKVSVKFVVEKDGSISNPQIIKGGNPLLNDEALRVVNSMPKWKPGKQRGKVVRVGYTVPIIFKLQ